MLAWVVWGSKKDFAWVEWSLIHIARVGVKVRFGLEKLFYKKKIINMEMTSFMDDPLQSAVLKVVPN